MTAPLDQLCVSDTRPQAPGRRFSRWPVALLLGLSAATLGSCKAKTGPGLRLRIASSPLVSGCVQGSPGQPIDSAGLSQAGSVRISVAQHRAAGGSGPQTLLCDLVAQVPGDKPDLDLSGIAAEQAPLLDFYGEYYDANGARLASGSLIGAWSADLAVAPTLLLYPQSGWSCPPSVMTSGRAFHSATLLPSGEVLLLGGIAETTSGSGMFSLLTSAEVFDPRSGGFVALPKLAIGRAFHQTAVLDSSGTTTRLLVYGGITAPAGQPAVVRDPASGNLRLDPTNSANPSSSTKAAQVLVYDSATRSLTVATDPTGNPPLVAFAGAAALPGGGLVTAGGTTVSSGGVTAKLAADTNLGALFAPPATPTTAAAAQVYNDMSPTAGLIGPSVTLLSASTALVLGAKVVRDMPPKFQGTVLGGLPAAVTAAALKPVSGASTAFHTATQLATSGQVLVTGGFEQDAVLLPQGASQFVQPPSTATAVRLYSVTGTTISAGGPVTNTYKAGSCPAAGAIAGSNDGHYRPAGYEAATATLSGNQVLITGGTPTVVDTVCVDCEPSDSTYSSHYLCGLTQASLYDDTSKSLAPAPALALGRLGHQQTRLLDGNILVTGGITHPGKLANTATAEAEIYNPTSAGQGATDDNDPLAPLRKAAAPASCTPL